MVKFAYRCSTCGKRYGRDEVRYLCPECGRSYRPGMPLRGVLTAEFDYRSIRRKFRRTRPDWGLFCAVEPRFFPPFEIDRKSTRLNSSHLGISYAVFCLK